MRITNYEDLIMKRAMDVFAEDGLKFFGIDKKVKELGPTELVVLESKNLHMDYTFLMEDDTYIHFEFQTTNKNVSDLRRFRAYEALLSHQTGKDVVTSSRLEKAINIDNLSTAEFIYNGIAEKRKEKKPEKVD